MSRIYNNNKLHLPFFKRKVLSADYDELQRSSLACYSSSLETQTLTSKISPQSLRGGRVNKLLRQMGNGNLAGVESWNSDFVFISSELWASLLLFSYWGSSYYLMVGYKTLCEDAVLNKMRKINICSYCLF